MGGYGSSRWGWHTAKQTAEVSKRLYIKPYIRAIRDLEKLEGGQHGTATHEPSWECGGKPNGNIGLKIEGGGENITAWLYYQVTDRQSGGKADYHYCVELQYTWLAWGDKRWWWTCPKCGRRCGTLYMPPGAVKFACRSCHNLTYQSCQESNKTNFFAQLITPDMLSDFPDLTPAEVAKMLDCDLSNKKIPKSIADKLRATAIAQVLEELEERANRDPYPGYLTAAELCDQSGLTPDDLAALEAARLLLTDRPSGRYRPKLKGWACKLVYLLREGWTIAELRSWAKGRWHTLNPRQWPPDREVWRTSPLL